MVNGKEILLTEEDEDHEEDMDCKSGSNTRNEQIDARRSLERIMERKALRNRLRDTFDDGPANLDELGW